MRQRAGGVLSLSPTLNASPSLFAVDFWSMWPEVLSSLLGAAEQSATLIGTFFFRFACRWQRT
jgi:hypothetical protein